MNCSSFIPPFGEEAAGQAAAADDANHHQEDQNSNNNANKLEDFFLFWMLGLWKSFKFWFLSLGFKISYEFFKLPFNSISNVNICPKIERSLSLSFFTSSKISYQYQNNNSCPKKVHKHLWNGLDHLAVDRSRLCSWSPQILFLLCKARLAKGHLLIHQN